jgi:predicted ArsR family transcriptional regulator
VIDWERLARANTHHIRISILEVMQIDGGRAMSATGLSTELQASLARVDYHLNQLEKAGFVELAYRKPVRGTTENFYRAVDR